MLSHRSKYALKALLVLSEEYGKRSFLISEIAEREHIPKRFLELILLELKNHGVLRSKQGKGGGMPSANRPICCRSEVSCGCSRVLWLRCPASARRLTRNARNAAMRRLAEFGF
jgi:hypothetical protein